MSVSSESEKVIFKLDQRTPDHPEYLFDCPGCGVNHWFKTTGKEPRWTYNGDPVTPTVKASIKVKHGPGGKNVCHFFITDGHIEYCGDCTHELNGQKVKMLPYKF